MAEKIVTIAIACPSCGKASEQLVRRLIPINSMACPSCGFVIDLQIGDAAALIQKLGKKRGGPGGGS